MTHVRLVADLVRHVVPLDRFRRDEIVHYSIPAFDELNGPALQHGSEVQSDKLLVRAGDVLIARLNPRKPRVVVVEAVGAWTLSSTEFVVLRPHAIEPPYLAYLLRSEGTRQALCSEVRSVTRSQQRVDSWHVGNLIIPEPCRSRQRVIVELLDRECARVAELQRSLEALSLGLVEPALARFASLTEGRATTQVGYHYEVQLGKMLDEGKVTDGVLVPYLRNNNVRWDQFDLSDIKQMRLDAADRRRYEVLPGDLLACEGRHVGKSAIWNGATAPIYYQKALHRIRPHSSASNRFLMWCLWLGNTRGDYYANGSGSTIPHLPAERLRRVHIPAVDRETQDVITRDADAVYFATRRAADVTTRLRVTLNEYRNALITEAVTGQLDVTAMSEQQMDERMHEAIEAPRV